MNKNKEGIKNYFEKVKWDPESSSGWHDVFEKKIPNWQNIYHSVYSEYGKRLLHEK